jgi:hypothetical protein
MHRFVVTASLKRDTAHLVAEILREGPPFDLSDTSLERHEIFLGDDELVVVFEGPGAEAEARRLFEAPGVLDRVRRIGQYLAAAPKLPGEVFSWERPREPDGVAFGPDPGPGDSDGGDVY